MTCLEPGREGIEERRTQEWHIALCGYGLTFTLRQRGHWTWFDPFHLPCCTGSDRPGRTRLRVRVGLATGPPLNFKVRLLVSSGGLLEYLFPNSQSTALPYKDLRI
jgi:hypothetical protein